MEAKTIGGTLRDVENEKLVNTTADLLREVTARIMPKFLSYIKRRGSGGRTHDALAHTVAQTKSEKLANTVADVKGMA